MLLKQEAKQILNKRVSNKNMIKHCLASGAVMRGLYEYLTGEKGKVYSESAEEWELAGLLHDADVDEADETIHGVLVGDWYGAQLSLPIIQAMAAHNPKTGNLPQTDMDWCLYAGEKLTGLIVAATLVLPSKKLADLTARSVLKRFKERSFAKGACRENILKCEKIGLSLEEFIKVCLRAMQEISGELGL